MSRMVIGIVAGSLLSVLTLSFLSNRSNPDHGPLGEAWPQVLHAQLAVSDSLAKEGLSTLVALAEELYWLRRAEADHAADLGSWVRQAGRIAKPSDNSEEKAITFLIERVSASLGHELDRWQGQMARIDALAPSERDAALRILAFAKWQQKGGAFEYAYDFFQQLSSNSVPEEKHPTEKRPTATATAVATPTATISPRPTQRRVAPTAAPTKFF